MKKHRITRRRSQKGGSWYNPFSWGKSEVPNDKKSITETVTGAATEAVNSGISIAETGLGKVGEGIGSAVSSVGESISSLNPFSSNENKYMSSSQMPSSNQSQSSVIMGGRHKRRVRSMRGGKGGLGLTYYASPVSGLKVAEPTTWQYYGNGQNQYSAKGGKKRWGGTKKKWCGKKCRRTCRHKHR